MKENLIKIKPRKEAKICFKNWCVSVYDENAEFINGLATVIAFVILLSTIIKSFKN